MTSDETFPRRFTIIDEWMRPDHFYLSPHDICWFIGEYTARKGFSYSATNQLIVNLKKPMDRKIRPDEWAHKEKAIQLVATSFRKALEPQILDQMTFVPVPPSRIKDDPLYDDRLIRMIRAIRPEPALDLRELIIQVESTDAVHSQEERPTPDEIEKLYQLNESLVNPKPSAIAIVDDLITTGAHYRAVKSVLTKRFPNSLIPGLFIARRVPQSDDA